MRFLIIIFILFISLTSFGQSIYTPGIDFPHSKLEDTTSLSLYSPIEYGDSNIFKILDPVLKFSTNSRYARGYNDGAVWKGRGINTEMHGGFLFKKGKIAMVFQPVLFYSQNKYWEYPDSLSTYPFGYPYSRNRIDLVERFGNKPFTQIHPGQSELRFELGKFVTSLGTANYTLGPAVFNPILMSDNAGGFPNLKIGIKPVYLTKKRKIGRFEGHFIYGFLKESDYFDNDPNIDLRYFNGMTLAFTPEILPGLTIGFNKVLYKTANRFKLRDILSPIINLDDGIINGDTLSNDSFDQIASLTMNWNFPEVGFRAYLEFAKNDFTSNGGGLRIALVEPEHTRGYTIGFEKKLLNDLETDISFLYEHTNLSIGHSGWRPTPSFYTHSVNRQGYTQNGQVIGAGIGPGGNSDNLGINYKKNKLAIMVLLQRIEKSRDYFVNNIRDSNFHDMEYTGSLSGQLSFTKFELFFGGSLSKNYSKYFGYEDPSNIGLNLGARLKL